MEKKEKKIIRVAELFAGVGGFRIGLEGYPRKKSSDYLTVWNNQWEPATKKQHASEVYISRFGPNGHSNIDIAKVNIKDIPRHDLLVGGFPCQDYSVARNLSSADGIIGKKGVLWWQIYRILKESGKNSPSYLMLENVDRLLKSPASQRGRDFAIILSSLNDLGYAVEWRVINAAEYGMPQRRRRVFIMGYKKNTNIYKQIIQNKNMLDWLSKSGVIGSAFPGVSENLLPDEFDIEGNIQEVSKKFNKKKASKSPFENSGVAINRHVTTIKLNPNYSGKRILIKDILVEEDLVPSEYFIEKESLKRWQYLKGAKKEPRKSKSGFEFIYTEGSMAFPDSIDAPSRTIVTGEGGPTPSRFKHVILTKSGKYRRLLPIELERLCMFPDNHTLGQSDSKRAFLMGNALVVGVIERLGKSLIKHIHS